MVVKPLKPEARYKNFIELNDGDFIYYVNPFVSLANLRAPLEELLKPTPDSKNQLIQAVKVKHVTGVPMTGDIKVDIAYKRFVKITYFRPEPILHSPDLEKIPTVTLIFNGDRNFWITRVKLEDKTGLWPVPYCTDRGFLTNFVKSTYGQ